MTSPSPPETGPTDDSPEAPLSGRALIRRRVGLVLAGGGVILIVLMWVAAFAHWGSTDSVDQLDDQRWTSEARAVCADDRKKFDELPAASDATTPQDRADSVEKSIDIFTSMTDELAALDPPSDPAEAALVTDWLGDWDRHIDDRLRFADVLEGGRKDAQFTESLREKKQISRYIDRFARVNDIEECGTPGDL